MEVRLGYKNYDEVAAAITGNRLLLNGNRPNGTSNDAVA